MEGITLGTDPELIFRNRNGLIKVTKYYERQAGHTGNNPEIGADGHPWIAELRSKPGDTPKAVVDDIKRILDNHKVDLPEDVAWQAGSFVDGKPIGGHIHFGGVTLEDPLMDALDGVMAQLVICLEDTPGARKRRAGQYGSLTDVRRKAWGFEYRTLPSWIFSPSISLGILALAKAVAYEEAIEGPSCVRNLKGDSLRVISRINNRKFINADKIYFQNKLPTIWKVIKRYRYFFTDEGKEYWQYVCLLKHIIDKYPDWHNDKDILHRWKIREPTPDSYKFERDVDGPVLQPDTTHQPEAAWDTIFDEHGNTVDITANTEDTLNW